MIRIVTHLTSRSVGVQTIQALQYVSAEDLPTLAPLERRPLLAEFARIAKSDSQVGDTAANKENVPERPPTQSQPKPNPQPAPTQSQPRMPLQEEQQQAARPQPVLDGSNFTFGIDWDKLPQEILQRLDEANAQEDTADPSDVDKVKLGIAHQVVEAYHIHRQRNARAQKTPGTAFYKTLTDDIFLKYNHCLKVLVSGKVIGDGRSSFTKKLGLCIDNLCRKFNTPQAGPVKKIKIGRGTVGVLPAQYNPSFTEAEKVEQERTKQYLINLHAAGPVGWDWVDIEDQMKKTYTLQREDVLKSKETVERSQDEDDEPDEIEIAPEDQALTVLKNSWPFLFEVKGLHIHHNRLAGRNLEERMEMFMREDVDLTLLFLSSSTGKNCVKNLKLKQKLDKMNLTPAKKMLAVVQMLANTFNENFGNLLLPAEKTLQPHEVRHAVPKLTAGPTLVSRGKEHLEAQSVYICVDRIPLMEIENSAEALLSFFHIIFCLDLDYPDLPKTLEYLERVVFGMGIAETRVCKKNGQLLIVLTPEVERLAKNYEIFKKTMNSEEQEELED